MRLIDFKHHLLTHIIERLDTQGELISHQERRAADRHLEGDQVGSPHASQLRRSSELIRVLSERHSGWLDALFTLTSAPRLLPLFVSLSALCVGWGAQAIGSDGRFHLLSPLFIGLMLWNLVSLSLLGVASVRASRRGRSERALFKPKSLALQELSEHKSTRHLLSWTLRLWRRFARSVLKGDKEEGALKANISGAFFEEYTLILRPLISSEARFYLHLSSLTLALGVIMGAYWDGLIEAYQATRDSTFLSAEGVEGLLSVVLAPSEWLMGAIKLTGSVDMKEGIAAPWVHRYALSMLSFVILPRLMFLLWERRQRASFQSALSAHLSLPGLTPTLNVALASHTNIGKTSLTRTLLRRDVGEVRDARNVTRERSAYYLINSAEGRLLLWDTPGFDDPKALLEALTTQPDPWRWARAHAREAQRFDYEAAVALYDEADVILYLVSASPSEEEVEQTRQEWEILRLIGKPIVCALNRTQRTEESSERALERWRALLGDEPLCLALIELDAHHRNLKQERAFYEAVTRAAPPELRSLGAELLSLYMRRHDDQLSAISALIYRRLEELALDRATKASKSSKRSLSALFKKSAPEEGDEALSKMSERMLSGRERFLSQLCDVMGLEGELKSSFEDLTEHLKRELSADHKGRRQQMGLWGAVISGVITGLSADLMAGGLTLGGGMLAGGVVGLLTGMGAAELHSHITQEGAQLKWDQALLTREYGSMLSMTLIASSFGRAQGQLNLNSEELALKERLSELSSEEQASAVIKSLLAHLEGREQAQGQLSAEAQIKATLTQLLS